MSNINQIREAMPATGDTVFLNTGTTGPLSTIAAEALQAGNSRELAQGRANLVEYKRLKETMDQLRGAIARLGRATAADIALTHHTTEGMNIAAHGLNWQPGDEIVTTDLEHPGGLLPLYVLRQRYGINIRLVELPPGSSSGEIVARLEQAITPRTRLLVFSHVAWNTGERLPLTEIVGMGHHHHVLSLVDGAQSAGAIPLDLPGSGVDFYALPGQKWLCGPEGIGALYVRPDRLSLLAPTFAGYLTMGTTGSYDLTGHFMPAADASRYEVGTVYRPGIRAMLAHLTWLEQEIGWDWIYSRIAHLFEYARQSLTDLAGVEVITPPGFQAGLVTFALTGYDPARVMLKLAEEDIILRYIQQPYALRVSTGFYNTEADIDRLIEALQAIQAADPDSLPRPE